MRTPTGEASLADRAATLSPAFRRMLRELDGSRSLADLALLFPQLDAEDLRLWISELLRQKMIQRAPTLTSSQKLRMRQGAGAPRQQQVRQLAAEIGPWLATLKHAPGEGAAGAAPDELARTARLVAIEASTTVGSIGREGYFLNPGKAYEAPAGGGERRILVVEDDEIQAGIVAKYVEKDGHRVQVVHSGAGLLAALQAQPAPDLLLLDVELPDSNGFALLEQLRANPTLHHLRVILLTGRTNRANIAKGVLLGADCYITKPFRPKTLMMAIRRLLPGA